MSLANNLVAVQSLVEKKLIASDTNGAIGVPVRIKDADKFNPWQVLRKAAPELPPAPIIYPEHAEKMAACALDAATIADEGYCSVDAVTAEKLTGYKYPGLLLPYWDYKGNELQTYETEDPKKKKAKKRVFFRLRPSWGRLSPAELSAAMKRFKVLDQKKLPKYLSPAGSPVKVYFPRANKAAEERGSAALLGVTEGEFSAAAASASGLSFVGLGGVYGYMTAKQDHTLNAALQHLFFSVNPFAKICILFDSDVATNVQVQAAVRMLGTSFVEAAEELAVIREDAERRKNGQTLIEDSEERDVIRPTAAKKARYRLRFSLLGRETNGDKNGVDDWIYRHGKSALAQVIHLHLPLYLKAKRDSAGRPSKAEAKQGANWACAFSAQPWEDEGLFVMPDAFKSRARTLRARLVTHASTGRWAMRNDTLYRYNGQTWEKASKDAMHSIPIEVGREIGYDDGNVRVHGEARALLKSELMSYEWEKRYEWNPEGLLAVQNGILDTRTLKLTPHDPKHKITSALGVPYHQSANPAEDCPTILNLLNHALVRPEKIKQLLSKLRYDLEPKKTDQPFQVQKGVQFVGPSGSGKSTMLELISALFGAAAGELSISELNRNGYVPADWRDHRILMQDDLKGKIPSATVGVINNIVANNPVTARHLFKEAIRARINAGIWLGMNKQFRVSASDSDGLGRRLMSFSFKKRQGAADTELFARCLPELPAFFSLIMQISFNEAIAICTQSGTERNEVEAYAMETNGVYAWLCGWLKQNSPNGLDSRHQKQLTDLYQIYKEDVENAGEFPVKRSNFRDVLMVLGCEVHATNGADVFSIPPVGDLDIYGLTGMTPPMFAASPPPPEPPPPLPPEPEPEAEETSVLKQAISVIHNTCQTFTDYQKALEAWPAEVAEQIRSAVADSHTYLIKRFHDAQVAEATAT